MAIHNCVFENNNALGQLWSVDGHGSNAGQGDNSHTIVVIIMKFELEDTRCN